MLVPIQDVGSNLQWNAASQLLPSNRLGASQTFVDTAELVDVSGTMVLLEAIVATAASIPEVDGDRVRRARRALAERKLEPNPDAIARSLVELDELLGR
jgi:hypothetical protein